MNMALSTEDYASIEQYDFVMGNVLGLTNDFFSWNVEKDQDTDRMRDGVMVLMEEHNTSAEAAKMMLLGIIVEQEGKAARLKEERQKQPVSNEILQYFEAIVLGEAATGTRPRLVIRILNRFCIMHICQTIMSLLN